MELGIKGNETRGAEVIKILEMLGGKNRHKMSGSIYDNYFYYIDNEYKDISYSYIGPDEIKGYKIFSLEDFLEKFPYKVGDKVKVWKNYDHFGGSRAELEVAEIKSMRWNSARREVAYRMKDQTGEFYKSDIKGKLTDDENVDKAFQGGYEKCKSEMNMNDKNVDLTLKISTCYVLPDGYHFADENGNVIDVKKIHLVKNTPSYPKTYEECCDVIGINRHDVEIDIPRPYQQNMFNLFKLLICRDAYWKTAGEQMGLDKPWEPDFSDDSLKYNIFSYENKITLSDNNWGNRILAFPSIEIRNAFYDNFKDLIELCKELL